MNTRTFFKSLTKAAAIVALAPQLCFKQKLELPALELAREEKAGLILDECFEAMRDMIVHRYNAGERNFASIYRGDQLLKTF